MVERELNAITMESQKLKSLVSELPYWTVLFVSMLICVAALVSFLRGPSAVIQRYEKALEDRGKTPTPESMLVLYEKLEQLGQDTPFQDYLAAKELMDSGDFERGVDQMVALANDEAFPPAQRWIIDFVASRSLETRIDRWNQPASQAAQMLDLNFPGSVSASTFAALERRLGNEDSALKYLKEACSDGLQCYQALFDFLKEQGLDEEYRDSAKRFVAEYQAEGFQSSAVGAAKIDEEKAVQLTYLSALLHLEQHEEFIHVVESSEVLASGDLGPLADQICQFVLQQLVSQSYPAALIAELFSQVDDFSSELQYVQPIVDRLYEQRNLQTFSDEILRELTINQETSATVLLAMGRAKASTGAKVEAASFFSRALEKSPRDARLHFSLAQLLRGDAMSNPGQVDAFSRNAVQLSPRNRQYWEFRFDLKKQQNALNSLTTELDQTMEVIGEFDFLVELRSRVSNELATRAD